MVQIPKAQDLKTGRLQFDLTLVFNENLHQNLKTIVLFNNCVVLEKEINVGLELFKTHFDLDADNVTFQNIIEIFFVPIMSPLKQQRFQKVLK